MVKAESRSVSLDILRGITIAFMIIVNTPGSWNYIYPPLRHSSWHGCTPSDMIFPFFLFIIGVSLWYSMKKYGHEINIGSLFRIFRRTLTVFALGLIIEIFPNFGKDLSTLRIMGVLQRIALAYGIGAIICLTIKRDYLWLAIAILLIFYWAMLAFSGNAEPYSLAGNLVAKVDAAVLGKNHLGTGFGIPFDPEGLLSTIPAICTVLIGYYIGEIVGKGSPEFKTALKLVLLGAASIGLGLLWSLVFPMNKPLWTSSFVLYTSGFALVILALIYLISDVLRLQKWGSFFLVFGTNALFAYFLTEIWTKFLLFVHIPSGDNKMSLYSWIYEKVCVPVAGNLNGSLMFAIMQMLLIWLILLILYRKKIMIRF